MTAFSSTPVPTRAIHLAKATTPCQMHGILKCPVHQPRHPIIQVSVQCHSPAVRSFFIFFNIFFKADSVSAQLS